MTPVNFYHTSYSASNSRGRRTSASAILGGRSLEVNAGKAPRRPRW